MSNPLTNRIYFMGEHSSTTSPTDPNLYNVDDIATAMLIDSVAISSATSKAVSTVNAAAPDSSSISTASSKATSAGSQGSIADSKSVSNSVNISVVDSKTASGSANTSVADSKAVSVGTSTPVVTAVVYSANISVADSKAVSITAAVAPPAGRTITSPSAYIANNAVFNVLDYATPGQTVNDGVTDATVAIAAAHAACVTAGGGRVRFPGGTYKVSAPTVLNLTTPIGVAWEGDGIGTLVKPTAALNGNPVFKLGSGSTDPHILARFRMRDFRIDGSLTSGAEGMLVGDNPANLSTYMRFDNIDVYSFGGVGGRAWRVKNQVSALFINCYGSQSTENLNIGNGAAASLPTELRFLSSHFRDGLGKGVVIEQVDDAAFTWSVIEGNLLDGLYCAPTSGQNVLNVNLDTCRFEGNNTALATNYQMTVDGSLGGGTLSVSHRNTKFQGVARGCYYKTAHNIVIDHPATVNVANQIVIDTGVDGYALNDQKNNSPYSTVLTNGSTGTFRVLSQELDTIQTTDVAYAAVPALQNGWVNNGAPYANAEFMKDALGWVNLRGFIKNGTVTAGTLLFTLAAGNRPTKQMIIPCVSNDAFCSLLIDVAGAVKIETLASATYLSLEGVRFRTY